MKPFIPFALLCALATSTAPGAVTDPVGYTTIDLEPGIFNLVGVSLHQSTAASGELSSASSDSVTDDAADFTTLDDSTIYILEITSGDGEGTIQEVTVASATTLTTPEDISPLVTDGTTYTVRPADTLDSVFGADNSGANLVPSTDGSSNGVDVILVQTASGFESFYYVDIPNTLEGWFDGANEAGDKVLNYADGIYVQTLPTSTVTDLVIAGEVKTGSTSSVLNPGFNLLNAVAPAGLTLGTSGLGQFVEASTDGSANGADIVLLPDLSDPGSFVSYYYVDIPNTLQGWFDGAEVADDIPLSGAFFVNNLEGSTKPYTLNGPTISAE